MGIFDIFKSKKKAPEPPMSDEDRKWNLLWEKWGNGEISSPYAELMEYESEVNNGGHSQYFSNIENCGELEASAETLCGILPDPLKANFQHAYETFLTQNSTDDDEISEKCDEVFEECDDTFWNNEDAIIDILKTQADTLALD